MSSRETIEGYLHSVENYFYASVTAVTGGLPDVNEVANRLWIDISRYGPGMPAFPEVHIPSLGDFQVPPPPPPPPKAPPSSFVNSLANWAHDNPKKASGVVVGVVGTGLLIGYRHAFNGRPPARSVTHKAASAQSGERERRQVVVVLGGDTPYGLPLIRDLESKGYIVIASVSTPEAVVALESKTKGYVKALVLNPREPATVPVFLRSLSSTLSRKFPLKTSGDPYSSPASQPYIQSVVSLLTLPAAAATSPTLGPLEHLSMEQDYLPYLYATQISPLQVIQQLLPLLRTGSARSVDKGKKSIVVCLPAVDTHVALPFSAVQAMSAAGTLKAVEILRREIAMAAVTGKTDSMKSIRVVTVDVGSIDLGKAAAAAAESNRANVLKATESWTSSEKLIYGPAFASVSQEAQQVAELGKWKGFLALFSEKRHYAVGRRPAKMSAFVKKVVGIVSEGRHGPTVFGHNLGLGIVMNWVHGDRVSVGAGANTYKLASYLPSLLLDGLLNLPYFLIGLRNKLLPIQPHRIPPRNLPSPRSSRSTDRPPQARQEGVQRAIAAAPEERPQPPVAVEEVAEEEEEVIQDEVETKSEPDTDESSPQISSNASVDSSWINLEHRAPSEGGVAS
ncbi:hypothetical protein D9611_004797 [Ephemerocybe angulata]|uniref:Uncharacterized protein n=1 Tax=Ephemerocybe angulata TaxID=980116 RepID=A0A8H5B546_9AGAR|nr:hypothetical protein D9611_004797 [Tulosesus angulatus]